MSPNRAIAAVATLLALTTGRPSSWETVPLHHGRVGREVGPEVGCGRHAGILCRSLNLEDLMPWVAGGRRRAQPGPGGVQ